MAPRSWMTRREAPRAELAKLRWRHHAQAMGRRLSQKSTPRELAPKEQTPLSQAPRDLALQGLQQGGTGETTETESKAPGAVAQRSQWAQRAEAQHEKLEELRIMQRA